MIKGGLSGEIYGWARVSGRRRPPQCPEASDGFGVCGHQGLCHEQRGSDLLVLKHPTLCDQTSKQ